MVSERWFGDRNSVRDTLVKLREDVHKGNATTGHNAAGGMMYRQTKLLKAVDAKVTLKWNVGTDEEYWEVDTDDKRAGIYRSLDATVKALTP